MRVRAAGPDDRDVVAAILTRSWGGSTVVAHSVVRDAATLPALVADVDGRVVGLLTYEVTDEGLEVVTLDAEVPGSGAGSALLAAAFDLASRAHTPRVWLVTTNDNLDAIRFYQRRGMRIINVSPGAVDAARALKPSIPLVGHHGIAIHDEMTLEWTGSV